MSEGAQESGLTPQALLLQRGLILFTLTFTTMLYAMTVTIANVSLPQMQGSLSATQDQIAWVVTFNIVATAVVTPTAGWLAARLGRRRVMLLSVAGFGIASALCGIATSVEELVLYRIAQGACGAPMVPLAQAIVYDTFPKRQHSQVLAIWGVGVILGPIIAPALGGVLSEIYSWRAVFFMIVPFALVALAGVLAFIHDREEESEAWLDWVGFLALAVAIAAFQIMLDRGERNGWFQSTEILIEAGVALAALWVFVTHCWTAERSFLNPQLLKDRNFALGLVLILLFGMLNFTPITLLPTLLQDVRGYPDSVIGWVLSARGFGTFIGFGLMFKGGKFDPRIFMVLGFGLQTVAGWGMTGFDANVTLYQVLWTAWLQGLGVGFLWVSLTTVTFATLAPRLVPEGTAFFHLLRNIGSSIHISLSVALVVRSTKAGYANLSENVSGYNEAFSLPWVRGGWGTDSLGELTGLSREIARQATVLGYIDAFTFFWVTAVAAIPLILLVRRPGR